MYSFSYPYQQNKTQFIPLDIHYQQNSPTDTTEYMYSFSHPYQQDKSPPGATEYMYWFHCIY